MPIRAIQFSAASLSLVCLLLCRALAALLRMVVLLQGTTTDFAGNPTKFGVICTDYQVDLDSCWLCVLSICFFITAHFLPCRRTNL